MYQKEFEKAVLRSKSFGLIVPNVEYSANVLLTDRKMGEFPYALRGAVGDIEVNEVVAQCLDIHYRLKGPIEKIFECQSYYTIGYVETNDQLMFHQSEDDLKNILNKGIEKRELNIHAWLTLPSMEILDVSLPTSYAILNKQEKGIGDVISDHPDNLKQGLKYHPMLVGDDFLRKIGGFIEFAI